jgi:hypothetical protein
VAVGESSVPDFVTVVTGVPRSGTSLVMQMLAAGGIEPLTDGLRLPDDDNPRGYFELEAVKRTRRDASWVREAVGRSVKVIHALVTALPADRAYRLIWVHRPFEEVIASQRAMLARHGAGDDVLAPERLAEIFRAQVQEAERWVAAQPGFASLAIDYHAVLDDPRAAAQSVDRFLGGGLDCRAMAGVVDAGLQRQRSSQRPTA